MMFRRFMRRKVKVPPAANVVPFPATKRAMIEALEAWRDGTPLKDLAIPHKTLGSFVAKYWPYDLPLCAREMFLLDNERNGRAIVLDAILENARAGRMWDRAAAKRVGAI
jgi:hypothetical protein